MTLPTYSAIQYHSKSEHLSHLYDACLLIVNTYNQSDMLDFYEHNGVTPYTFMTFARNILNHIAEGN
jgi:N-acetylglucosamine kinase-like BadF-type ATPase